MDKKVQSYNFKCPDRISKNQIRSLQFIHDRFSRNASSSVSAYLRMVVELSLDAIDQVPYSEFLAHAADPTCYASLSLQPLGGQGALEIQPEGIFPIIDRLLGGFGEGLQTVRPMTEIEQRIVQPVLKLIVENLKESWKPVYGIDFATTSLETQPNMVQVVAPNEMVIRFQFKIRIKHITAKLNLALPSQILEPIMHVFDQEGHSRPKVVNDGALVEQMRQVPVNLSVETSETTFPLQSLISLEVGDTLVLNHKPDWPMEVKLAGRKKLLAAPRPDRSKKLFSVIGLAGRKKEEMRG